MGQSPSQNYSKVVNTLIFIFPIVINSLQVAGDLVLFILAMMGIFIAISQKLSPFTIKEIKPKRLVRNPFASKLGRYFNSFAESR
jgi:hypothetical protein